MVAHQIRSFSFYSEGCRLESKHVPQPEVGNEDTFNKQEIRGKWIKNAFTPTR